MREHLQIIFEYYYFTMQPRLHSCVFRCVLWLHISCVMYARVCDCVQCTDRVKRAKLHSDYYMNSFMAGVHVLGIYALVLYTTHNTQLVVLCNCTDYNIILNVRVCVLSLCASMPSICAEKKMKYGTRSTCWSAYIVNIILMMRSQYLIEHLRTYVRTITNTMHITECTKWNRFQYCGFCFER